jgi:hypothetical protein|eukprot:COSAG01_NODE_3653_length_5823_cov_10.850280_2_plen_113_part_00
MPSPPCVPPRVKKYPLPFSGGGGGAPFSVVAAGGGGALPPISKILVYLFRHKINGIIDIRSTGKKYLDQPAKQNMEGSHSIQYPIAAELALPVIPPPRVQDGSGRVFVRQMG